MIEQFVPKYYVMDPETEEVVFDGKSLADGMVILIADPNERARPEKDLDGDWGQDRLLERNRWCTVSKVVVEPGVNSLYFLATYEDGTQRKRSYSIQQSWIVKKDSIVASLDVTTERYMNVYSVINEAFIKHDEYCCMTCNGGSDAPSNKSLVEDATKQVLGLL